MTTLNPTTASTISPSATITAASPQTGKNPLQAPTRKRLGGRAPTNTASAGTIRTAIAATAAARNRLDHPRAKVLLTQALELMRQTRDLVEQGGADGGGQPDSEDGSRESTSVSEQDLDAGDAATPPPTVMTSSSGRPFKWLSGRTRKQKAKTAPSWIDGWMDPTLGEAVQKLEFLVRLNATASARRHRAGNATGLASAVNTKELREAAQAAASKADALLKALESEVMKNAATLLQAERAEKFEILKAEKKEAEKAKKANAIAKADGKGKGKRGGKLITVLARDKANSTGASTRRINRQLKRRQQRQRARIQNSSATGRTNESTPTPSPGTNSTAGTVEAAPAPVPSRPRRRSVSEQVAASKRAARDFHARGGRARRGRTFFDAA